MAIEESVGSIDDFREWINRLCEEGRAAKLKSYAGFYADAQRYAEAIRNQPEKYQTWPPLKLACNLCNDDPDGIRLVGDTVNGTIEWCTCARATALRSEHGEHGDERLRELRAEYESLIEQLRSLETNPKGARTKQPPVETNSLGDRGETTQENTDKIVDVIMCPNGYSSRRPIRLWAQSLRVITA